MPAKDKYTIFNAHSRGYRKGMHKVPKFTRVRLPTTRSFLHSLALADNTPCQPQGFLTVYYLYSILSTIYAHFFSRSIHSDRLTGSLTACSSVV